MASFKLALYESTAYRVWCRTREDWGKYRADATMANTILDRLMHRCAMLEFEGKSYRLQEADARIAVTGDSS